MLEGTPLTLVGHDAVAVPTMLAVRTGRAAHAYLVSGPAHTGKSTLARLLAAAAVCLDDAAPCGRCSACHRVAQGVHPDVETLRPGGVCDSSDHDHSTDRSRDIRICQVRRVERLLSLSPYEGRCRVLIFDPADALNSQSADAFLKTLEEPPPRSLMMLVTAEPGLLSDTIRSRCRALTLSRVSEEAIRQVLIATGEIDADRAAVLARLAGGGAGWALTAARAPDFLTQRARRLDEAVTLARAGRVERLAAAERLAAVFTRNRDEVSATLSTWVDWWRDVLLMAAGVPAGMVNTDRQDEIEAAAGASRAAGAWRALVALRQARQDLESNVSPRLALDALMLGLPLLPRGVT